MSTSATPHDPPAPPEEVLFEGRPALLPSIGSLLLCVLTVGLALPFLWLRQLGVHYKVTSERVVVERGILSKQMEQIDIYRINDYTVDRPLGQRMMGTGNLVIDAMDRSTPHVHLNGLKTDVVALYEQLRAATEIQKRLRGVRVVDYE